MVSSKNLGLARDIINYAFSRFNFVKDSKLGRIVINLQAELLEEITKDEYWLIDNVNCEICELEITNILLIFKGLIKYLIDNESNLLIEFVLKYNHDNDIPKLVWPYRGSYFVNGCNHSAKNEHFLNPYLNEVLEEGYRRYFSKEGFKHRNIIEKLFHSVIESITFIEKIQISCFEKKKNIIESSYCLTLDHVPKEFYQEILNNTKQIEEWMHIYNLTFLNDFKQLDEEFLVTHSSMMLDTRHFSKDFKDRLFSKLEDLDENIDGIIIHGDNYDGLRFLQENYKGKIGFTYIDPPYNRGKDEFRYKDNYHHASWLCLMEGLFKEHKKLCKDNSVFFISIDDIERPYLECFITSYFTRDIRLGPIIVQSNKGGRDYLPIAKQHEYILCYYTGDLPTINLLARDETEFKFEDHSGKWINRELRNRNPRFNRGNRPNLFYPFYVNPNSTDNNGFCSVSLEKTDEYSIEVFPKDSKGRDDCWRWGKTKSRDNLDPNDIRSSNIVARQRRDGGWNIYEKYRSTGKKAKTIWLDKEFRTENGTIQLRELFGKAVIDFPKPVELIQQCLHLGSNPDDTILDYFAGSGTTAHAVINLNRRDGGNRKYILVEKEDYAQTIILPRIKKVVFSPKWRNGVPQAFFGISHIVKCIRLETYCDCLEDMIIDTSKYNFKSS